MRLSRALIARLPKADLHSHIDGSIPARDLCAMAARHRRKLLSPSGHELRTPPELLAHIRGQGYDTLLEDIVARFHPIVGLMQTEEILREAGVAYVKELKNRNVVYAEGRFAPQYHTREGLTHAQAIDAFAQGLSEGLEQYGVRTKLIVAIGTEASASLGVDVSRAAVQSGQAVALDQGGPEAGHRFTKFRDAFDIAHRGGLRVTVHAGEGAGSVSQNLKNIRAAIVELGAERVGHAIDLAKDRDLVHLAKERRVAIEMNPISNLVLSKIGDLRDLRIDELLASGLAVTVNSDDPALWQNGNINDVLSRVCDAYGFGLDELDSLITNSFRSSFASDKEKAEMLEDYTTARRLTS